MTLFLQLVSFSFLCWQWQKLIPGCLGAAPGALRWYQIPASPLFFSRIAGLVTSHQALPQKIFVRLGLCNSHLVIGIKWLESAPASKSLFWPSCRCFLEGGSKIQMKKRLERGTCSSQGWHESDPTHLLNAGGKDPPDRLHKYLVHQILCTGSLSRFWESLLGDKLVLAPSGFPPAMKTLIFWCALNLSMSTISGVARGLDTKSSESWTWALPQDPLGEANSTLCFERPVDLASNSRWRPSILCLEQSLKVKGRAWHPGWTLPLPFPSYATAC